MSEDFWFTLGAVIEDVAAEYMHEWKAARFTRTHDFAKAMAEKVVEVMREPEPALSPTTSAVSSEGET